MTIYNATNNISEDYTFIIDINEVLYTQEELSTLNLDIYQYSSSQDDITWNTVNSSDIDDVYAILGGDLADLSNPNILDITADFSEILEESQNSNKTVLIYCGIQDDNRNGFPDFDDNQYFILVIHRNPESYYCIPIKSHILDNNIQIVDVETFEPLDFEYLSAKQVQNLIYSLISKMEILEFVETLPPKSSARTNCIYLLTETPSDPTDLIDDGLNLNFGLYTYSKTINDYKKLDTLTFNIKNFVKKTDIIDNLTSTVIDAPLSAKQGKILNDNLASHIHGNITNDGKIGASNNSNKNVITDASGKITIENKPTIPSIVDNLNSTSSTSVLSAKQGKILNDNKQDLLISGTNIKTINSQSLLGNGDITISDLFFKTKNGSTPNYINLFEIRPTGNYQAKPITFEIVRGTKPTPIYVSVRLANTTLASNLYAPQDIYTWGVSDTPVYIRKEADNVFNVIVYHLAKEEISVCNMNNPNPSVKITPLGTVYGIDAPVTSGDNQVWIGTYTVGGTTFGTGPNNVIRGNDSRLSDARNPKSTKISAGSDLDTYTTTGFYYNNANSDCATITPLPQPDKAFFLQVEDWGTSNYTKQTITHYYPVKTYERIRNAGTWTDWYELQHNDGTGGENLLRTEPENDGNSGVGYTIADETFHNDKVYYRNETSQDTTKYGGWRWLIPKTEFDYGDVFTLSFYAKGTSDAEIMTYFAGASGYISNRRISSNSDVDADKTIGSYGDGATRFHLTSDWKRYYVTYQLHSTATTPTQNKSIHIRTLGASTDIEFYISNVKLERGYYATDYDRHTRDNEPLYFPTEVSLPTTTTSRSRRKFIHPPYKFKNIPNWTVEGEIKVTGNSARFELHKTDDTNLKNFIAVGKNGLGNLAYWWGTSSSAESSKTYDASHIAVDTWYPFRISRMGNNVLFMFNNTDNYEVTTTYFNTFEYIEPSIFGYATNGVSVRNLKITPLEPVHPLSPSSSVCTNAQGIITTESKNNHTHSDTQLNWNGTATNNSVSPLLMAMDSEFGANRLAYFPSSRIKVEYSTNGGSTWTELTTGNYSEANKTKLVTTTSEYMFLGNNSTTDYSKNRLRITFDVGDMNTDSILYLITRKIALFTGTANSTGFTCQIQTQTYAQYNTNSETFSNYGSAFALGGWSGWNTAPLDIILGGYKSSNQTNSSSERIKALRLLFTQTGGTGNGLVAKVRLYGETAHKTASQYANNNHIYTINENQDATFPSKIIKKGGTSDEVLLANGDVANLPTIVDNLTTNDATKVLSAKQGKILNDNKQDLLISGTNIKTINNQSLLGNGDITISGGGSVNIRTSSTGFSSTLTDTKVPSEKLIKEYVDNAIGNIQNFIHS